MKIALCFSGHMRTYENAFPYIKTQILDSLNCDIFIHTIKDNNINWNNVVKNYNPKLITVADQIAFSDPYLSKYKNNSNISVISMYYDIYSCNKLKKQYEKINNIKYDCVIRLRPDGILNNKIKESDFNNLDKVYVNKCGTPNTWVDDTFAFSSSENMDLYSNTYLYLAEFYNIEQSLHPETMLRYCLQKHNIETYVGDIKFALLRIE